MRCISWLDSSCVLVGCLDGKIHQWRIGQQVNVSCFVVFVVVIAVVVLVMMVVYVCLLPVSKHPFFFIFHTSTSTVVLCC